MTEDQPEPSPSQAVKRSRTNTPWTAEEERRLKSMRDAGSNWSEIAKVRLTRQPNIDLAYTPIARLFQVEQRVASRNIGIRWLSLWQPPGTTSNDFKDMHYADFAEDEVSPTARTFMIMTHVLMSMSRVRLF